MNCDAGLNCKAAKLILVQIGRNNLLDAKLRASALEHARDCRECGVRLANERMLTAGLGLLADEHLEMVPPPALKAALMTKYKNQFVYRQRVRILWRAVAAAAACLALVTLVPLATRGKLQSSAFDNRALELIAIDADTALQFGNGEDGNGTEPFIAIPYAEPLAPYERTELQRVKLTRGTLLAMGLATEVPDADEPMNAELIVGEDGIPRAVRILN